MEKVTDLSAQEQALANDENSDIDIKAGTVEDREAMRRLGKQQLFKVTQTKHSTTLTNVSAAKFRLC